MNLGSWRHENTESETIFMQRYNVNVIGADLFQLCPFFIFKLFQLFFELNFLLKGNDSDWLRTEFQNLNLLRVKSFIVYSLPTVMKI